MGLRPVSGSNAMIGVLAVAGVSPSMMLAMSRWAMAASSASVYWSMVLTSPTS